MSEWTNAELIAFAEERMAEEDGFCDYKDLRDGFKAAVAELAKSEAARIEAERERDELRAAAREVVCDQRGGRLIPREGMLEERTRENLKRLERAIEQARRGE